MDNELMTEESKFVESEKDALNGEKEDEEGESQSLLPHKRGGLSKKPGNPKLKVHWNDRHGKNLVQIVEFQPSDASDSEEDDSDYCMCTIM